MDQKLCPNCFTPLEGETQFCKHCGATVAQDWEKYPSALPYGTVLAGRYVTGRILGQGGFGITYCAYDYTSKQRVAIKEFFPDTMASRGAGNSIIPYTGQRTDDFVYGKNTFLEEAKTLAQFIQVPGIVHVHSYFEEFGTAYFAMEFIEGVSLQKYLEKSGGKISWDEAKRILKPVMESLATVHAKGIIHRDVKPDNISLTKDGTVKILDFGSARYSMGEKSRSLDVVLTHGFAPREQYSRHGRQGAYTDVYALAATFYYCVTGKKPQDSIDRMDEDCLAAPSSLGARIPAAEEDVLMKALAVEPQDRYQSMPEFRQALEAAENGFAAPARTQPTYSAPAPAPAYPAGGFQTAQQPAAAYRPPMQTAGTFQAPQQTAYQRPAQTAGNFQAPQQTAYQRPAQTVPGGYANQGYSAPQPTAAGYSQPAAGYRTTAQTPGYAPQPNAPRPAAAPPAKKSKKWLIPVLAGGGGLAVLALILIIVLATAGSKTKPTGSTPTETREVLSSSSHDNAETVNPTETNYVIPPYNPSEGGGGSDNADFAGYYSFLSMAYGGIKLDASGMRTAGLDPDQYYLILNGDFTGMISLGEDQSNLTWSRSGVLTFPDGSTQDYSLSGGVVTINTELEQGTAILEFTRTGDASGGGSGGSGSGGAQAADGLSGTCGDSATWVFDEDSGTLTISGTGAIYDYDYTDDIPWFHLNEQIDDLVIEEGITRIGKGAFYKCETGAVDLPDSLTSVGNLAFAYNAYLYSIRFPDNVTVIGDGALYHCEKTENIYVFCNEVEIQGDAFNGCTKAKIAVFTGTIRSIGDGAFEGCEMSVFYPEGDSSWNGVAGKNYGGNLTWVLGGGTGHWQNSDKYRFILPSTWDIECSVEFDGDTTRVYHTPSKDANCGGYLFGIALFQNESDYNEAPSYEKLGTLKKGSTVYDVVVFYPTDLQTDSAHQDAYMRYFNEISAVLKSITGRNSFGFWY